MACGGFVLRILMCAEHCGTFWKVWRGGFVLRRRVVEGFGALWRGLACMGAGGDAMEPSSQGARGRQKSERWMADGGVKVGK